MALVRVPFYFRNFLPTSLLYIYIYILIMMRPQSPTKLVRWACVVCVVCVWVMMRPRSPTKLARCWVWGRKQVVRV